MKECLIVDAFPAFLTFWPSVVDLPMDEQIQAWRDVYLAPWPELVRKQINQYNDEGENWLNVAREYVFPDLNDRLPAMREAHVNLLELVPPLYHRAKQALGFESQIVVVIYVGIGLGAGWVTTYEDSPAILFGLENIAECSWSDRISLSGLIAHEIGHIVHFHWRAEEAKSDGMGPWWQLYTEGFAMRCELMIAGSESWHMRERGDGDDWLAWCRQNEKWLAAEFLRVVDNGESVRPFFGSWYDIQGFKQTGYYLGHRLIQSLEEELELHKIALMDSGDPRVHRALERLAGHG
jgi:hypothetical protein